MRRSRAERGAGTLLGLGLLGVLALALVAVAALGQVTAARGGARTAADLAALVAAEELHALRPPSSGGPCAAALRVVELNGSSLVACRIEGGTVLVEARRGTRAGYRASALARAGPA